MRRLKKLEIYKDCSTSKKGTPNTDLSFAHSYCNPPKNKKLRVIEMVYLAAREWFLFWISRKKRIIIK